MGNRLEQRPTGYQSFTPGNNSYALVTNSVTAPPGATLATIYFHFAGAAIVGQTATIDFDDVSLAGGTPNAGTPPVTNYLAAATGPVVKISWASAVGRVVTTTEWTIEPGTRAVERELFGNDRQWRHGIVSQSDNQHGVHCFLGW